MVFRISSDLPTAHHPRHQALRWPLLMLLLTSAWLFAHRCASRRELPRTSTCWRIPLLKSRRAPAGREAGAGMELAFPSQRDGAWSDRRRSLHRGRSGSGPLRQTLSADSATEAQHRAVFAGPAGSFLRSGALRNRGTRGNTTAATVSMPRSSRVSSPTGGRSRARRTCPSLSRSCATGKRPAGTRGQFDSS